ncbi:porphobilinogen synthase [Candidatus Methylacidithermus pantelleriae]|uniref:Delta-aminolevulinic acid dehydratase n=1 Tax=Candidatus Methylacidithermus pantelleriae TaxID=2744239 RepID=A0A8J2BNR2_9BACT|nr:porphobilinogen synthase [Candidatus Methylacidithermus pantelleriae]CAF0694637.1 Delta-aminolevulinic acid dehydratase [Candidatus Methylacidithermus pantelleriae]
MWENPSRGLSCRYRLRRLRKTSSIRGLVRECELEIDHLVAPIFVREEGKDPEPIASLPGIFRHSLQELPRYCTRLFELGIRAVVLFPCLSPERKDPKGKAALDEKGVVVQAVRAIKAELPSLCVVTDVALDPYTSHGHDGIWDPERDWVDNDATVAILCEMAVLHAWAGADFVAPSDMMDGRVGAIRERLDSQGYPYTGIISYAAKFASAYYGPFREAIGSAQPGSFGVDKSTYQLSVTNVREALRDAKLDEEEGADILMVKPAGPYLDVLAKLREKTLLPLAAYQVSGEYAQIVAAAEHGWVERARVRDESLLAIKRAGADLIFTYFAEEVARERASQRDRFV